MTSQPHIRAVSIIRAAKVIESCDTLAQLKTAKRYAELALRGGLSPAYKMIVKSAQEYFLLNEELESIIKKCESNIVNRV